MPTGKTPETGADPCHRIIWRLWQPLEAERCPTRAFKEMSGPPKSR